jgi:replicative DNA helicase
MKTPFTVEFEQAVLVCLVQDQKFMREALSVLRPEYFVEALHASACACISSAYVKTKLPPSKVGLLSGLVEAERQRLRSKKNSEEEIIIEPCRKLVDVLYAPHNAMADVQQRFLEFCRQREMENVILEQHEKLEKGEIGPAEVADAVRRTHQRLSSKSQGGSNFFMDLMNLPAEIMEQRGKMWTTGFPGLDEKMGGGVSAGTLAVVLAGPKGGKSTVLRNTGYKNMARQKTKVVHFTCEISEKKTKKWYASRMSRIPYHKLHEQPDLMVQRCAEFWEKNESMLIVKGYPAATATCDDFRSYLYWLELDQNIKADLVIIDYGDEVLPIEKKGEVRHDLGQVYKEMRVLADEFAVPVVTASQTNRESLDKQVITMKDISESIQKVQVADHIFSVCMTDEERKQGKGRLFFAGSREAETGGQINIVHDFGTSFMEQARDQLIITHN